ncbi:LytTR family DNA-binding domain-containing protein [uncultured Robinsoniella sp.]|uniref:LytTR family DNA-binding domain-containing protein n=1 Tax=uncultured Robinsoniella sp. TaxID=904190 RepID=UPI00374F123A
MYQLMEELGNAGFVQVSKACIINLQVLTGIRPLLNSRMEATLTNGEKINITRKYVASIREKLQER